jgi:hypothetical protein
MWPEPATRLRERAPTRLKTMGRPAAMVTTALRRTHARADHVPVTTRWSAPPWINAMTVEFVTPCLENVLLPQLPMEPHATTEASAPSPTPVSKGRVLEQPPLSAQPKTNAMWPGPAIPPREPAPVLQRPTELHVTTAAFAPNPIPVRQVHAQGLTRWSALLRINATSPEPATLPRGPAPTRPRPMA